ncbi:hypothetical protein Acr_15g0007360 [Actinidia rufa]|uniref:Uncharacterized protein n=1 Tax=Actinidia rufa TaxID=165716 RepID=A0A7J0FUL5_9ERIC|nr:hypothetical protein Acr_15g0007360 [Actinidia rufa]
MDYGIDDDERDDPYPLPIAIRSDRAKRRERQRRRERKTMTDNLYPPLAVRGCSRQLRERDTSESMKWRGYGSFSFDFGCAF